MKAFVLCCVLVLGNCFTSLAVIGVGYNYKDMLFWRFWEIKEGVLVPEIMVYNNSDSSVAFVIRKVYVEDRFIDSSSRKWFEEQSMRYAQDTIVKTAIIPAHQYGVYVLGHEKIRGGFDGAFINGKNAGIVSHEMRKPEGIPLEHKLYRYYSYEGMYGTPGHALICKNQLTTRHGDAEKLHLFFDFSEKMRPQFFSGIRELSCDLTSGIAAATVQFEAQTFVLDQNNKNVKFVANMVNDHAYNMDVSCTLTKDADLPSFDMRAYFSNGSGGVRLPFFAE